MPIRVPSPAAGARPPSGASGDPRLRWAVSGIGTLALLAVFWHMAPLATIDDFRPFEPLFPRAVVLAAALGAWVWLNWEADLRDRQRNRRLLAGLAADGMPEADADAADNELATVEARFAEVIARLGEARLGQRWGGRTVYQLPWYMVIGAPGSGKTTAIAAAKLGAPFTGGRPVYGIGGTRNCEWWFTSNAVVLDTAGRYTTQDSRGPADARVWSGVLELLREHRPRQPLNGVIVTISLADLAVWSDAERRMHARLLRQRLADMAGVLGVRPPVYILCTKADLITGFTAFFDALDARERAQPWGLSFDTTQAARSGDDLRESYLSLLRRLDERLLERLHQEPEARRRNRIFAFPLQMAALEEPLVDLLAVALGSGPGEEPSPLRGVWFVSAAQSGEMVDPLMRGPAVDQEEEMGQASVMAEGASFFLDRLLPDMVFSEANLVGVNRSVERERWRRHALTTAVMVAASVLLIVAWVASLNGNRALLAETAAAAEAAQRQIAVLDTPPRSLARVDDTDFPLVLPALDALRAMPYGYGATAATQGVAKPPLLLTAGLFQGGRLGAQADQLYRRALRTVFLSRLVLRLEDQMRTSWALPDHLRLGLRAYQMLGGREPMDAAFFSAWMAADWQRTLPGQENEPVRRAISEHLSALLAVGFSPVPVDDALIQRVGEVLEQSVNPAPEQPAGGRRAPT